MIKIVDGQPVEMTPEEIANFEADRAVPLEVSQAQAWEHIKAERERRRVGGVKVGAHWFHSDDSSRIQQIGLVMLGQNIPAGLKWKVIGGALVDMTPTLAQQIFGAQAARDAALFAVAEQHIGAAAQAADPLAYDYSAGWPD